jgi:hypothetical protein
MGISSLKKSVSDNWELITTATATSQTTLTLSSIDPVYSKLLLTWSITYSSNYANHYLTINNDSGSNYMSIADGGFLNDTYGYIKASSETAHTLVASSSTYSTANSGLAYIFNADTTGGKNIESYSICNPVTKGNGFYAASAAVTRLDIAGLSFSGTVKLYGVRV